MSRNFFDRYRLRALIDELIATDPENTPVENRNIDWLIQRYLAHIHPKDAHRRIITDPELEKDIYSEPRHLNHLPRARIRHFFAAQAEWLLAHMLVSRSKQVKLLNTKQWIRFCHEARLDAIEAKKHGIRWGVSHGSTVDAKRSYDLSRNLAKFGHTPMFWKRRLEIATEKKEKTPKVCFFDISTSHQALISFANTGTEQSFVSESPRSFSSSGSIPIRLRLQRTVDSRRTRLWSR